MRRRAFLLISIVCLGFVLLSGGLLPAGETTWKVGTARAKITPEKPLWLSGYGGRNRPAEGTLHDLWIKVLALEATDGHRAVVVASDLLGFPQGMYDSICEELRAKCDLDRAQIMLTASHSHTSPVLKDALYDIYPLDDEQRALIEEYSLALEKTIAKAVVEALSQMTPATLHAGEGTATFAVNRRNNRASEVPGLRERGVPLKGPVDHRVPVLAVRTPEGELRAVVVGYACHCTTLSFYQWSGDYAGFTQIALEKSHPEMQAMFYQGCGADQNPLPRRSVEVCRNYGEMLAAAVEEVLAKPMRPVAPRLRTRLEFLNPAFGQQPTAAELETAAAGGGYRGRWGKRLLEKLQEGGQFETSYPRYPVQVWKLGTDQLWIALGGEVVVDYALFFQAKYGPQTWVAGYTNDVMAYIPSHRVWQEGGYESGAFSVYGLPAVRWTEDLEEQITRCVDRLAGEE